MVFIRQIIAIIFVLCKPRPSPPPYRPYSNPEPPKIHSNQKKLVTHPGKNSSLLTEVKRFQLSIRSLIFDNVLVNWIVILMCDVLVWLGCTFNCTSFIVWSESLGKNIQNDTAAASPKCPTCASPITLKRAQLIALQHERRLHNRLKSRVSPRNNIPLLIQRDNTCDRERDFEAGMEFIRDTQWSMISDPSPNTSPRPGYTDY